MFEILLASLMPIAATQSSVVEGAIEAATAAAEAAQAKAQSAPPATEANLQEPTESREDYFKRQAYPEEGSMPWISLKDYPAESWVAGEEGEVGYEVFVSEEGTITDCAIVYSSGHLGLDTLTCDLLMTRAKLIPGTGPNGEPVAGSYTSFINWNKDEPQLKGDYSIEVRFELDAAGEQVNCEVVEVSGDMPARTKASFERDPCPRNMAGEAGVPYRDDNGMPIGKIITVRLDVKLEDVPR